MKGNGKQKRRRYELELWYQTEIDQMAGSQRVGFLALVKRWHGAWPARSFWQLDVTTGDWREL